MAFIKKSKERVAVVVATQRQNPILYRSLESLRVLTIEAADLIFVDNSSGENLYKWIPQT